MFCCSQLTSSQHHTFPKGSKYRRCSYHPEYQTFKTTSNGVFIFLFLIFCCQKKSNFYQNSHIIYILTSQDSIPGSDSEPADYLVHYLHPGLHSAQSTAEKGGKKRHPWSFGKRCDRAGGA